jgi:multisubunit Na+/H+ antiporter MnhG subunit
MQRLIFAIAALTLALTASSVARADFAIVRFPDGYCQIWWDSAANPWGAGWSKIAMGLPDSEVAHAVLGNAIAQNVCR